MKIMKRPELEFDPNEESHRAFFHTFMKTKTWGTCPYVFKVRGVGYPLPRMQAMLLEYYADKEFGG